MLDTTYAFGSFELRPRERRLDFSGQPVPLGGRAFDILLALTEARGEVVSRRTLLDRVWNDTIVAEGALRVHMVALRKALARYDGHEAILNAPGRGYSLGIPVTLRDAGEPRRSLPLRLSSVIGRDALIGELVDSVKAHRLVTLVGIGGVGKTTVALSTAASPQIGFDQVKFVDLAVVEEGGKTPRAVAEAVGAPITRHDPTSDVATALRDQRMLLVLDNCEHIVADVASFAAALLNAAPGVHILATSREPLGCEGEWLRRVHPLDFPAGDTDALSASAVQLFVERASAAGAPFVLQDDNAPYVAAICRYLEGLPLAIELAARWASQVPIQVLLDQLRNDHLLGIRAHRLAPLRHQSLEAMLNWSVGRLSSDASALFRRLAVFRGEFSRRFAEQVAAFDALGVGQIRAALDELVSKSLVEVGHRGSDITYRLQAVTRAYALDRLRESPDGGPARRAHAELVMSWLRDTEPSWLSLARPAWVERYAGYLDEIRSALDWTLSEAGDNAVGAELAILSTVVWFRLSLAFEGHEYLSRALRRTLADPSPDKVLEMRLRGSMGGLDVYGAIGDRSNWAQVARLAEELDDDEHRMIALWARWLMAAHGRPRMAMEFALPFERLALKQPEIVHRAAAARMVATAHMIDGNLTESRRRMDELLSYCRKPMQQSGVIRFQLDQAISSRGQMALVLWLQGFPDQAWKYARWAEEAARETGHTVSISWALLDAVAQIALMCGHVDAARAAIDDQREGPAVRNYWGPEEAKGLRALALCMGGDLDAGLDTLAASLDPRGSRFVFRFPYLLGEACEAVARAGQLPLALAVADAAIDKLAPLILAPELMRAKGELVLMSSTRDAALQADELFSQAMAEAKRQKSRSIQLKIALSQARLWVQQGQEDRAEKLLRPPLHWFSEGFGTKMVRDARQLLEQIRTESPAG